MCGVKYDPNSDNGRRLRRIADHVRACTFAVHENVYPGPNKEKYVVKRLLRRAVLDGHQMGVREPFLHKLVPMVAEMMKRPYPELSETVDARQQRHREGRGELLRHDRRRARIASSGCSTRCKQREPRDRRRRRGGRDVHRRTACRPSCSRRMAAEHNLAFDWARLSTGDGGARRELGQGAATVDVFTHGPIDALKKALHAHRVPRLRNDRSRGQDRGHHRPAISCATRSTKSATRSRSPSCSIRRRSTARSAARSATPARSSATASLRGDRHADATAASSLHHGHLREGMLEAGRKVTARVDAERRAGHSPGPLGHAHPALRAAKESGQARPAAGLEGRRRLAAVRLRQSVGRSTREQLAADRRRSERAGRWRPSRSAGRSCRWPRPARPAR